MKSYGIHPRTDGRSCPCAECRAVRARWARFAVRRRVRMELGEAEPLFVDSVGTARRLQALAVLGYSTLALQPMTGIAARNLRNYRRMTESKVRPATAEKIARVYRELIAKPLPTGRGSRRTRGDAQREGWLGPFEWDSIDDASELPHSWKKRRTGKVAA